MVEVSVDLEIACWWSIGLSIVLALQREQVLHNNFINKELEEKVELIWHEQGVDLHHKDLVVVAKSLEDHDPERVWNLVQVVHLAVIRAEIGDQQQDQTVIVSIVHELDEDALIIDWVDE